MTLPVRIAFCITELDPGGAERMLFELATGLDREKWEPRVWCLGPEAEFAGQIRDRGVPVTCLNAHGLSSSFAVLTRLQRDWREWKPQLMQGFLFHANILGRMAARWAGVPIVLSGQRVADRRSRWYARLDRMTTGLVSRHVCVSRGVADFLVQECGFPAGKMEVIPNGIAADRLTNSAPFDWTTIGIPAAASVILAVGRLEPQKGFVDLLQGAAPVLQANPEWHLVILGEGPQRAELESLVSALQVSGRVHLPGRHAEVPRLMRSSRLFVLSSHWEGMANVLLEAMAAGLPVIATNVEGVADVIRPESDGLIIPSGNPTAIEQALQRLVVNPEFASKLGATAQQTIQERFTISRTIAAYDELYSRLLADRR